MTSPAEKRQYDQYQQTNNRLADAVGAQLAALGALRGAGTIDPAAFDQLAPSIVMAGKQLAARNADLAVSAALTARRGTDVLPTGAGVPAASEEARLRAAVDTIMEEAVAAAADAAKADPTARLERLGRSETWQSASDAWHGALKRHRVEKWTRQAAGNSCPACISLADGKELSIDTPMWTHPGCDCVQAIIN